MPIQFKFPKGKHAELCEQPVDPNVFWVQDRINVGQLKDREIQESLEHPFDSFGAYHKSLKVLTNEVFDPVYSVLYHLEDVSLTIRKELIQHLV